MKFHWPLFIAVVLGFCLTAFWNAMEVSAASGNAIVNIPAVDESNDGEKEEFIDEPDGSVMITAPIGESQADEAAYSKALKETVQKGAIYSMPEANIGQEISQTIGGKEGEDIGETILPPKDDEGYEF